jgi:hypothetical protein
VRDGVSVVRGGQWFTRRSASAGPSERDYRFGSTDDTPLLGPWIADGVSRPGVARSGSWHLSSAFKRPVASNVVLFGRSTDTFVVADWDGDGITQPVAVRDQTFYIRYSLTDGRAVAVPFGG